MSDVADILVDLGVKVTAERSRGDGSIEYQALCPWHHEGTKVDHNPDWWINSESGRHTCFSCGFSGSLEWLIHKVTGLPMKEAARKTGLDERALNKVKRLDPWAGERPIEPPPMNEARILMYGQPPEWALDARRLTAADVDHYGIRWADPFIHGSARTEYPNCWVTPIRDPEDYRTIGMQVKQEGGGEDRFFRNLPATVPKSETLFGVEHLDGGTAVLVESPLDAAYAHSLGYCGVASMGASVSSEQMELLISRCERLILALDDDESGWKSTRRLLGLRPDGKPDRRAEDYSKRIPIRVANYDEGHGKDIGAMVRPMARRVLDSALPAYRLQMGWV